MSIPVTNFLIPNNDKMIYKNEGATYRDLLEQLKSMNNVQLECNISVELILSQECLSSVEGDVSLDIAGVNNDYLDVNHPVFIVQY